MLDFIQIIIDTFSARLNYAKNIDIDEDLVLGRFNLVYDRSREVEGFYSSLSSTKEDTYWAAFKKQVITSLKKDNQEYGFMTLEEVNYYGQRIEYSKWKLKRLRYQLKAELHNRWILLSIFNNYSKHIYDGHWMPNNMYFSKRRSYWRVVRDLSAKPNDPNFYWRQKPKVRFYPISKSLVYRSYTSLLFITFSVIYETNWNIRTLSVRERQHPEKIYFSEFNHFKEELQSCDYRIAWYRRKIKIIKNYENNSWIRLRENFTYKRK